MKQLFTQKGDGRLFVLKENEVYECIDFNLMSHVFYDNHGNVIENYTRPTITYDTNEFDVSDRDFVKAIGEGFYVYTTHEISHDPDGQYGLFGIKSFNGEKLTEEIYFQVDCFNNGFCSVSKAWGEWGCINTSGELVVPYKFSERLIFNQYGVAAGDGSLIDCSGNEIPETNLDFSDGCYEDERYFTFSSFTQEQEMAYREGREIQNLMINVYDTKTRRYVVKGIPEDALAVHLFDGEPEVILAAVDLLKNFDKVEVWRQSTIIGKKGQEQTVFSFYEN